MDKDSLDFVDNTTVLNWYIGFFLFLKKGLAIQLGHGLGVSRLSGTILRLQSKRGGAIILHSSIAGVYARRNSGSSCLPCQ